MSKPAARTTDYVGRAPGIAFGMSVWAGTADAKDSIHAALKHQQDDIKPMDLFVVEPAPKVSPRDNNATPAPAPESQPSPPSPRPPPAPPPPSSFPVPVSRASSPSAPSPAPRR